MTSQSPNTQPNILLLFADQHRADWLGHVGTQGVETPTIDRLAARGATFGMTWCSSPLCAPSRACLTAGRQYDNQPVRSNSDNYPLDGPSFYRALRAAGYWVTACGKTDLRMPSRSWGASGWHERPDGSSALADLGFSAAIDNGGKYMAVGANRAGVPEPYATFLAEEELLETHVADYANRSFPAPISTDPRCYVNTDPTPLPDDAYCDNWIARNGRLLVDNAPEGQPWFLQVNFTGPHDPMDITDSMSEAWSDREMAPPVATDSLDSEKHQDIRRNYAAMIENIDRNCGELIDWLESTGRLKNTVVIYSSDHGEMLGDLGHWAKVVPYQPSISVPLVIAGPGFTPGQQTMSPVAHVDITATILDLAGAKLDGELEGLSLLPFLCGRDNSPRRDLVLSGIGTWRAISDGRLKYIRGYRPETPIDEMTKGSYDPSDDLPELLFDLVSDPHEQNDLSDSRPEDLERMRELARANGM